MWKHWQYLFGQEVWHGTLFKAHSAHILIHTLSIVTEPSGTPFLTVQKAVLRLTTELLVLTA